MSSRGKILVIRGGAIGDFILTLPAIAALRRQFPAAHLEVLGYPHIVQLAMAGGLVDRVQSIEARALAGFFARGGQLSEDLADYFSEFDIIISYLFDPDLIFQTNVKLCSAAQFIVGPHRPNEREKLHATKVYLKPLERLAIFDADDVPRLSMGGTPSMVSQNSLKGNRDAVERVPPTLALHPGSGSEKKNWPEQNWAELARRLIATTQFKLLLVGGEAEGERLKRLVTRLSSPSPSEKEEGGRVRRPVVPSLHPLTPLLRGEGDESARRGGVLEINERIQIAQSLPLVELAGLLQNCVAFIGHDSGISHLAAALGIPGLILWGDTTEEIWRPPHERISILKSDGGLKQTGVQEVLSALKQLMEKSFLSCASTDSEAK